MKTKITLLLSAVFFLLFETKMFAQQVPTGAANGTLAPTLANSSFSWFRGGNNIAGNGAANNVMATNFNSPIYWGTNGNLASNTGSGLKMKLNGLFTAGTQYPINGYPTAAFPAPSTSVNTTGYLLLSINNLGVSGNPIMGTQNQGAFSQLHLNGDGTFVQEFGYRPWMKTGVTFTSNNDLMYVGHKRNGIGTDITDAVVAWSDNGSGPSGPDVLKFVFTAGSNSANVNPKDPVSFDGYEYMRMAGSPTILNSAGANVGHIGIGPLFTNAAGPQSRLHIHAEDALTTWMQISNEIVGVNGTGQTATDGTRFGILDNGNALLYNQENRNILFSTNTATPANAAAPTNERVRITSTNTPGTQNPLSLANATRVSISENPTTPVNNPLSLLHIGENNIAGDGTRSWMDVGTLNYRGTNNMYVGMRHIFTSPNNPDNNDEIIDWGDNAYPNVAGPEDMLRFTFTSCTGCGGNASTPFGREGARMIGDINNVFTGFGGDIDPTFNNPYTAIDVLKNGEPGNTVEINSFLGGAAGGPLFPNICGGTGASGLRFTDLTSASLTCPANNKVLTVNASGDVILVPATGGGLGTCTPFAPTTFAPGANGAIDLTNNNNFFFIGNGAGTAVNNVAIGKTCVVPVAKLDVLQNSGSTNGSIGIFVENKDQQTTIGNPPVIGLKSLVNVSSGTKLTESI
ncbi:MAG: hypothetical protein HY063_12835 [Bacteroidetes bacterium]|nr:hypothetical protein [Bacteroidota bacterium]